MTVHVVATGGTISSHWDGSGWTNVDGPTLVAELGDLSWLGTDVTVVDAAAGPSSNLSMADMFAIAARVADALDDGATGVVVLHGTDTIELTAFATQVVLGVSATRRPVVFTGSMRVHSHAAPDGPRNLRDALAVATSDAAVGREVLVCMEGALHAADRVRKHDASSLDAFGSAPFAPVGRVGSGGVEFAAPAVTRPGLGRVDVARLVDVPLVVCAPGMPASTVEFALAGAPAAVVEGFGDLNLPHEVWRPVHEAAARGCVIAVASPAFTPTTTDEGLDALGVLAAGGLTAQRARLLLAAATAAGLDRDGVRTVLHDMALARDAGERGTT